MKKILWFRHDLRLEDNHALNKVCEISSKLCFLSSVKRVIISSKSKFKVNKPNLYFQPKLNNLYIRPKIPMMPIMTIIIIIDMMAITINSTLAMAVPLQKWTITWVCASWRSAASDMLETLKGCFGYC